MKKLLTAIIFCLFVLTGAAISSEGHRDQNAQQEFRINGAAVKLSVSPPTFVTGKTPDVIIELTDMASGSPILDAGIYILLEKPTNSSSHAGHVMQEAPSGKVVSDIGLDFGETPRTDTKTDISMFWKVEPAQKAGVYSVVYPMEDEGVYTYTLAVKSLNGRKFKEPLIYGGTLPYHSASKAPLYRMWVVMAVILLSGIIGIWMIAQRRLLSQSSGQKLNLLDIPWVKRFFKSAWFQPVFQVPVLFVFLVIIAAGLLDIQQGDRNIATLLMWTIWWAAIIFTFVMVGRVWCMMCPFGAVQDWIGRLFSLNRNFPALVRNMWTSSFLFFGLTWWDSYSGIVNKPALTAYLLLVFFAAAIVLALVFKGRSFCRYVCPIGGLIGLYSMFSPLELRNKCLEVCRGHKTKECIKGTGNSHPCPMFVTPMTLDRNNYCNFCSECIKSCSQDNIVIRFRSFAKDLWVSAKGYLDEAYLALVILGVSIIVTAEMVEPWHTWIDAIGRNIPYQALGLTDHVRAEKFTTIVVMTVGSLALPILLLIAAAWIVKKTTGPDSPLNLKDTLVNFSYMFIPVGLAMHLAHNISHLFKEGPGIVPAVQRVFYEYVKVGSPPNWNISPLLGSESIFWLQMTVMVSLNIFSLYAGYRIAVKHYGGRALRAFVPMAVLAVGFMMVNTFVLGQPMALRHSH